MDYETLASGISVPSGPCALVAESFSGPIGIRLAARHPQIEALVLVASFAHSPIRMGRMIARLLPRRWVPVPPAFALRFGLLGKGADDADVHTLRQAIQSAGAEQLAHRLRSVLSVDVRKEWKELRDIRLLYIAGSHDRLVRRRTWLSLKALQPGMRVEVLNAPHLVLQRQPRKAASLISTFLLGGAAG